MEQSGLSSTLQLEGRGVVAAGGALPFLPELEGESCQSFLKGGLFWLFSLLFKLVPCML